MMNRNRRGDVVYLTFPSFENLPSVWHAFSTRLGGVSQGIYSSMNLNFKCGDDETTVRENYRIFCGAISVDPETLVASDQTHTANIRAVTKEDRGKGFLRPRDWKDVDGLVTGDEQVTLVTHYADCVPLFFADPVRRVVAAAHAGWKGTALGIADKMVRTMRDDFGCDPSDIRVGIGPSIGPCCFEVDGAAAKAFLDLPEPIRRGCIRERPVVSDPSVLKYDVSLQGVNQNLLLRAGIRQEHLEIAGICTRCNQDWLFSHRATKGRRGGMIAVIGLK